MYDNQALDNLRKWLQEHYFQGIVIPSNDCHFDEYVPERFAVRAAVSGFDGSAGTLVVTNRKAALWTDSRYFLQAARQLQGTGIELMKLKMAGTPTIVGWLKSELPGGSRIAVDGNLFSQGEFDTLSGDIAPYELCAIDDPFDDILQSRPAMPAAPIYIIDERYSGESVVSKRQRLIAKANLEGSFAFVISTTDDIMWLCNIRGGDIEYNSVALSYCVVTSDGLHLFCNLPCLEQSAAQYLASQGVTLHEYDTFRQFLGNLKVDKVMFSSNLATVQTYSAVPKGIEVVKDSVIGGVLPMLKCRKNAVELDGFRKALLNDGIAQAKLLKFIDENVASGVLNEYNVALKLISLRSECPDYLGESFEPIVAFNANAAAAHYSVENEEGAAKITQRGFLLMDTGAHYPYGTTDTTRTIYLGSFDTPEEDAEARRDYTLVLKGMIDLACAVFPAGTRGSQLDILARGPMFATGKMYYHGTSHGVGHHLCVHEAPQIRMEENPIALDKGMVMSDEPAVYVEGHYGIRTENMVAIVPYCSNAEYGDFFKFETLTLVPIETSIICRELLNEAELSWIEAFNRNVIETLAPYLSAEEIAWMRRKYL